MGWKLGVGSSYDQTLQCNTAVHVSKAEILLQDARECSAPGTTAVVLHNQTDSRVLDGTAVRYGGRSAGAPPDISIC